MGVLAVLDVEPYLDGSNDQWIRRLPKPGEPRCDLPCPEHWRREWYVPSATGVTRCYLPLGHIVAALPRHVVHMGILADVVLGAAVLSLLQWQPSEADLPA